METVNLKRLYQATKTNRATQRASLYVIVALIGSVAWLAFSFYQVTTLRKESAHLKTESSQLKKESSELKKQSSDLKQESVTLLKENENRKQEVLRLEDTLSETRNKSIAAQHELASTRWKVGDTQRSLKDKITKLTEAKSDLQLTEEQLRILEQVRRVYLINAIPKTTTPVHKNVSWLTGRWTGVAFQKDTRTTWTIQLTARDNEYVVSYPKQPCSAVWILLEESDTTAKFREILTEGFYSCVDRGYIILERLGDPSQIIFNYFNPEDPKGVEVMSSAILTRQ